MSYGIVVQNLQINGTPTDKDTLIYDSGSGSLDYGVVNAVQIQGKNVVGTTPADGNSLVYDAGSGHWIPDAVVATGGFRWQSAWDGGTTYLTNDLVIYNGLEYIANSGSTGVTPTTGAAVSAAAYVTDSSGNPVFQLQCSKPGLAGNNVQVRLVSITDSYNWYKTNPLVIFGLMQIDRWQAGKVYCPGDMVLDNRGCVQICSSSGPFPSGNSEPVWAAGIGAPDFFGGQNSETNLNWECGGRLPGVDQVTILLPNTNSNWSTTNAAGSSMVLYNATQAFTPSGERPEQNLLGFQLPITESGGAITFTGLYGTTYSGGSSITTIATGPWNYITMADGLDVTTSANWDLFTITGAQGIQGIQGIQGASGDTVDAVAAAYTASGSITQKTGLVVISGSSLSMTLDPPTVGTDDGKKLRIMNDSVNTNTVTLTTGHWNGDTTFSKTVATFGANWSDAFFECEAYNGSWFITQNPTLNAGINYSITLA